MVVVLPVSGAVELVVVVLDESVDFCATSGGGAESPVAPVAPAGPGGPATAAGACVVVSLHPMDMVPAHITRAAMAVNEAERLEIFIGSAYQDRPGPHAYDRLGWLPA